MKGENQVCFQPLHCSSAFDKKVMCKGGNQMRCNNAETSSVDYRQYKQESGKHLTFELPLTVWDRNLLPLCDWGCLNTSFLDMRTDQVLRGAPLSRTTYVLRLQASSLQEWLELWLRDVL